MADSENVYKLLVIGLVFHLFFCYSVFDCYFTSPVVTGMQSFNVEALSKRVVLIVGDGLRADLLFQKNGFPMIENGPEIVAPYLRSIIEQRGAWGVSHTHVPTESRPGHVAIIGGMYEDVSAVTKGWKLNPVDFDSVFNRSSKTFSFGSPDILPMFAHGAVPGKVDIFTYDAADEDFTKDASALDVWVLNRLRMLFKNATVDPILDASMRSDKVIFFLHLLGLDTTGHSYRPFSAEYMNNIMVVDNIVRQTEELFQEFYGDAETSFIFTADHGMSVIGNHGDGHPDNTRTPLVAWGKGIRGPLKDSTPSSHDSYSASWGLDHLFRRDVEQADIAPLMASLIGIDWPINSVGVLPDVDPYQRAGYLLSPAADQYVAQAALVNAKVMIEHYGVKQARKSSHKLFFRPFKPLADISSDGIPGKLALEEIEMLIRHQNWQTARERASALIKTGLSGLHYLQVYDRTLLRGIVAVAYAGWAAYSSLFVFRPHLARPHDHSTLTNALSLLVLASFWGLFAVERAPWTYFAYVTFPCYFWQQFLSWSPLLRQSHFTRPLKDAILKLILVLVALLAMVTGYTHRAIWSVVFFLMGTLWPLFAWPPQMIKSRITVASCWIVLCLTSAVFPLLDVNKSENLTTIMVGGTLMSLIGVIFLYHGPEIRGSVKILLFTQVSLIIGTMIVTASSVNNLQAKRGLPLANQIFGWLFLTIGSLVPLLSQVTHTVVSKLLMYFLSFGPCFVILSISVEGLFYIAYSLTLVCWIYIERHLRTHLNEMSTKEERYTFKPDDLRIVLFFLFFVQVGFFGTGNVASISSFYLSPVYRLIPVFEPFSMSLLLIFKIIAPYVMLSASFAALHHFLRLPPFSLFMVALMLTDVMTLAFFFNVLDTGSWLEIGQTISFFCITSLLLVWSGALCAFGEHLMGNVLVEPKKRVD